MARTKQTARKDRSVPHGRFMDKLDNRPPGVVQKRKKPYTKVFREMKRLQRRTDLIISKYQMTRQIYRIIIHTFIYMYKNTLFAEKSIKQFNTLITSNFP